MVGLHVVTAAEAVRTGPLAAVIVTMLADKLVPVSLNFWAHAGALLLVNVLLVAAALGLYSATHRAPHRMPAAASQVES